MKKKKKALCLLLCFALILCMAPFTALAESGTVHVSVETSSTNVNGGDTVNYDVYLDDCSSLEDGLYNLDFNVSIPTGLQFVDGSGVVDSNFAAATGWMAPAWNQGTMKFSSIGALASGYTGGKIKVLSFSCTVKDDASGPQTVSLINVVATAKTGQFDSNTTEATITVTAAPVAVTGVQIDESVVLDVGESKQVNWAVNPTTATNQNVELTIDDTSIATVSETGLVKGVAVGEATITITTEDGGYTDTCKVTVNCPHTNKTNVGAKPSTCIEKGWEAYSKCNDCEQLFDSEGNEINDIPYLPLSTTHTEGKEWKYNDTQHWHECTVVGCGTVIETSRANHSGGTATCQNKAVCATCNQPYGAFAEHNYGELIAQVNPVHTPEGLTDGTAAHYKCSVCNKLFNELQDEVTAAELVIPAAHTFGTEWEYDETQHWHECTCGAKEDIAAHSFQWIVDTSATEETTGLQHEECECGKTRSEKTVIPKLNHTHNWIETPAKPSTCVENGNNQYFYCTKCEKYFKSDKANETTVEAETLPLADHTPSATWSYDGTYHWKVCTVAGCGTVINETKAEHIPDHPYATTEYPVKCTECGYEMEAQLVASTPVTNIAATVTAPALGQKPDYAPVIVANPADSVDLEEVYWYKIAAADFTGTDEDDWVEMASDETFTTGYYYSVDMYFNPNEGYKMSESATGTVNGMPHDDTYGELYEGDSAAYLCGLFDPLTVEYTIDLPFSLAVKLTGDEKPAKETFKFEIYDLGVEDAEFEIVKDSVTVENIAFDENGVAFIEGIIKIKVTGKEQLSNLTEGFSVRMVKGSAKGWTYATEQWNVTPVIFEGTTDADFNIGFDVREIVDGVESEIPANGMSFSVSYEAVTEPETPKTGDSSNMLLWAALLLAGGLGTFGTVAYSKKRKEDAE